MNRLVFVLAIAIVSEGFGFAQGVTGRIPATPLIVHDPYFSIWSTTDSLFNDWPRHWTGRPNGMTGLIRVDGKVWRLMGRAPADIQTARQISRRITPTRTTYELTAGGVRATLSFLCPQLAWDPDVISMPIAYLSWELCSEDGRSHGVEIYFDMTAEAAVNTPDQNVVWSRFALPGFQAVRIGSQDQRILEKKGDDLRIDWGYLYVAATEGVSLALGGHDRLRREFAAMGTVPKADDLRCPRPANDDLPVIACRQAFAEVSARPARGRVVVAYDDLFGIQYFHRNLPAYWRRGRMGGAELLEKAVRQQESLDQTCRAFDDEFLKDAADAGGPEYQELAVLAYRQCLAANKIVADIDGSMLMFPKENFSNGCIGTVDVIYPASPLFLLFNPSLLKAQLKPLLQYASLPRWKFPFAPHDLGTYPHANGQVYGGGELTEEDQMPVEESGNMLLMVAGIAVAEGTPEFALRYWGVLQKWAEYLKAKGFDPENQLCTDDFAGHLAHNVNLSAKAILALGAYARLNEMIGKASEAKAYRTLAEQFVQDWIKQADEGDHTRLAFDRPGTWSQKYNLVWDKMLNLNLFPREVFAKEIQFYLTHQNAYGLPLDNREAYTKIDWILWSASLAESKSEFQAFVEPVVRFLQDTPDRVPMTDWYWTTSGRKRGFQARSVVGGVFVKMLLDKQLAAKWFRRAKP